MGRQKPKDPPPMLAPLWIMTFTDMTSLLLTFFIMILTFSSMEEEKFKDAAGSLAGAFGVLTPDRVPSKRDIEKQQNLQYLDQHREGITDPSMRKEQIDEAMNKIQNPDIFKTKVERDDVIEGSRLKITPLENEELFHLGTDRLTENARQVITEMGIFFRGTKARLLIETHIDNLSWQFGADSAAEMTRRQAHAIAKVLEEAGMTPERIGVTPMGETMPLNANATSRERYENRRIEVLVMPDFKDPLMRP